MVSTCSPSQLPPSPSPRGVVHIGAGSEWRYLLGQQTDGRERTPCFLYG